MVEKLADSFQCRICSKRGAHRTFRVPELQFRMGESFTYFECGTCGCLQLAEIPPDMAQYYPQNYYSYMTGSKTSFYRRFKNRLERSRNRFGLYGEGVVGRLLQAVLPELALPKLARLSPSHDSRILDVGSGSGRPLQFLADEGFGNVTGIDPFIKEDTFHPNGLRILKKDLMEMEGRWDIILFNHSLEHMPDNLGALKKAFSLLEENGWCVVSIPTVSSFSWRHYGIYWHALDAPRHIFLHSLDSFRRVVEQAGFAIKDSVYDSQATQFWYSENFRRGLSIKANETLQIWLSDRIMRAVHFIPQHLRAMRLNREGQGDLVAFFLQKR